MTDLPITFGQIQNPYKEITLTIPAGKASDVIYYDFNYFRIMTLTGAGLTAQFGGSGSFTSVIGAGIGIRFDQPIKQLRLGNVSGAPITVTLALMIGNIADDRLNVSGNINVINAPGTELEVKNPDLEALLQNPDVLRAGLTDLTNASYAQVNNTTTVVVAAGANVNGVIIRTLATQALSYAGYVQLGANYLYRKTVGAYDTDGTLFTNIFVPPGVSITLSNTGGSAYTTMIYEIL